MGEGTTPDVSVEGAARRRVTPDRVTVTVGLRTDAVATPQDALRDAVAARERLRQRVASALPGVERADGRLTAEPRHAQRTRPLPAGGENPAGGADVEWVVTGYAGVGDMTLEADAVRAAEIVDALRGHPDAARVAAEFSVASATRDAVHDALQCDALRDARERAARLASALGQDIGPALGIDAGAAGPGWDGGGPMALMAKSQGDDGEEDAAMSELVPEPVDVVATVRVRFALRAPQG